MCPKSRSSHSGMFFAYQGMSGSRRQWVKGLLNQIEGEVPHVRSNLLASMGRVRNRHLLTAWKDQMGDKAFSVTEEGVN